MIKKPAGRLSPFRIPAVLFSVILVIFFHGSMAILAAEAATLSADPLALRGRVSAGLLHSLILQLDGRLYAMGDNQFGQLGNPIEADQYEPYPVSLPEKVVSVSAGAYHSLALTSSGQVYTFGRNAFGQLGNGTTENQMTPQKADSLPMAKAVAAGAYHSLVLAEDGSVWAFGNNTLGQCGNALSEPVQNEKGEPIARRVIRPQKILDRDAIAIAAGSSHSLILLSNGQVMAFGDNSLGQLGNGTTSPDQKESVMAGVANARQIAAGGDHSLIVTDDGQTLLAFGDNSLGQTGTGSDFGPKAHVLTPTMVDWKKGAGKGTYAISDVYAGFGNSAVVISQLDVKNHDPRQVKILLWGSNAFGQLGAGTGSSRDLPQALLTVDQERSGDQYLPIDSLAIGNGHVLILSSRGLLGSSGRNDNGQAGQPAARNPAKFANVTLPPLVDPVTVEGISSPAADASTLKNVMWGDRLNDDGFVLALQVPWDTTGISGHGDVRPKFDHRILIFAGISLLVVLAAGLVIRSFRKKTASPKRHPDAS